MNLDLALGTAVAGIVNGAYYALLGLAIALIYRTTAVANFAQGELGTLGTFIMVLYVTKLPLGPVPQLIVSVLISAGVSALAYVALLGPRRDADPLNLTVRTLGLFTLIHAVTLYLWGANEPYTVQGLFAAGNVDIGGFRLAYDQIGTLVIAAVLGLALFALFRFTRVGLAMRSVAMNADVASMLGIDVDRIALVVWFISGAIGALVAMLIAPVSFLGRASCSRICSRPSPPRCWAASTASRAWCSAGSARRDRKLCRDVGVDSPARAVHVRDPPARPAVQAGGFVRPPARGARMSAKGRSRARISPAARSAEVSPKSGAGPPRGRLCERGEAQARSARPRAWMAADEE